MTIQSDMERVWEIEIRERVARLEAKYESSDKALDLARGQVSRASLISAITVILSVIAIAVAYFKN